MPGVGRRLFPPADSVVRKAKASALAERSIQSLPSVEERTCPTSSENDADNCERQMDCPDYPREANLKRFNVTSVFAQVVQNPVLAILILVGLIVTTAVISRAANPVVTYSAALGGNHEGGIVGTFPDISAASTGFTSIPTARALANPPRWLSDKVTSIRADAVIPSKAKLSLGIVGLPVDIDHEILSGATISSYCLTPQKTDEIISLCQDARQLYGKFAFSGKYNLCDFDSDCWHSTAVAILASGAKKDPFPSQAWLGEGVEFKSQKFGNIARSNYNDYLNGGRAKKGEFSKFVSERFPGFGRIMNASLPIATISYNASATSAYISKNMVIERGVRNGGNILALNVFSRFESAIECDGHKKKAPCVLTTTDAQVQALKYILKTVRARGASSADGRPPPLGAIVIVAGGELTNRQCSDHPMAKLIGELREEGVLTFVPVGNDGAASKVRFPACASQAISVGSLTRDGKIESFSNGSETTLVNLYVDGETVVLPIRGPRLAPGPAWIPIQEEERDPTSCENTDEGSCEVRDPNDQYNPYLAGGTLLSAAVAAGEFLNLRERHPAVKPEDVWEAIVAKRTSQPIELDEAAAEGALVNR